MDYDHKWLVSLINNLYTEMGKGDGKSIINKIINQLVEYSKYHFSNEERLMEKTNYQYFDMHKAQHDAFFAKVGSFKKK
jgi:hemerythrin-like metal-binding protein